MNGEPGLSDVAQLFKVLGNESRLSLLLLISNTPMTVGSLVQEAKMSQPLVSQHLRTLRQTGLVTAQRSGKEITYQLADQHVMHVISDALTHVREPAASAD